MLCTMKLLRLSGRKVCERVKTKGFLWKGKHFNARYLKGLPRNLPESAPQGLYTGLVTSTKLDKSAVKRNRMRRRCREALRVTLRNQQTSKPVNQQTPPVNHSSQSYQLLLLPRSSSLSSPFGEIQNDAEALVRFLTTRA
jgi:ribonuclease P protein component